MKNLINKDTPIKIIWILLFELWQQSQSLQHTQSNAWAISSEDSLNKVVRENRENKDYLLSLLKW